MPTTSREKLAYIALTAIPIYLWTKLIKTYLDYKRNIKEITKTHHKHNCVVTYNKDGMCGWPEYPYRLKLTLTNLNTSVEPVVFFIETATERLDIAVMILSHDVIIDALFRAAQKGIKLRLILDARYDSNKEKTRRLSKLGAKVLLDEKFLNTDTMMHNKYAIKDFNSETGGGGFSLSSSMNWTQSAFMENYEFLVLTSSTQVVRAFMKNFEETWEFLQKIKETSRLNETLYQL